MEQYFATLRECPLFQEMDLQEITRALACLNAKVLRFGKGESVLKEGDPANYMGIVLAGMLQIVRTDFFGNRNIIASIVPGELFGESFACAGVEEVPVAVTAVQAAQVMLIDCRKLTRTCGSLCQFRQRLIFNLLHIVAAKNLIFHQKIEVTSKRTTREKLMTYLMLQAKQHNSLEFEIPYNRQELADYLEVERSGLSVEIGKLCRQGVIETARRYFKLCRPFDL